LAGDAQAEAGTAREGAGASEQAEAIWEGTLDHLRLQMVRLTFDLHLATSWPLAWDPEANAWTIGVRHAHSADWLNHRLERLVLRALAWQTPDRPRPTVQFVAASRPRVPARTAPEAGPDDAAQPIVAEPRPEVPASRASSAIALGPNDYYIKLKTSFRKEALRRLKGVKLAVFLCLALHMDRDGVSAPGVERLMWETGYARSTVCSALEELCSPSLHLIEKLPAHRRATNRYRLRGYVWFGANPAPALYEEESMV
jgi:hypothetical protein